ncbi:TatD family hydrolase [Chryseobacterium chendengshani]|uniref:TatD family hydrolase n=1 Tax=unclassified Chryseobacterium TaxID=2593645 RepID=UPI001C63BF75|nr:MULTISPECIES: TatD family hydrolase [unclassified Chryseobacterium]MBW7675170.1 TatD family hydrolase [Chryseobacterium sp. LJ756]MBW8522280.1 TatD family hydrolase [Chryseobacterium sp. LJ668]QYK17919.1 TatD family hydrolase [Chryseobacterium sp. LJ668]
MDFFDFHHHKKNIPGGIYNLQTGSQPSAVSFSAGIHPQDIQQENIKNQFDWLQSVITDNCFAIGECGLDGLISLDMKIQEDVFLRQIKIANEFKKPLIIHCVKKFYEVISFRKKSEQAMIIHGFNKKQSVANDLLRNNFYLSFGKAVLYHLSLQDTLKTVPLDKLFLETDNDDFDIKELYQKVSEIKKISIEQLQKKIIENLETIKNG